MREKCRISVLQHGFWFERNADKGITQPETDRANEFGIAENDSAFNQRMECNFRASNPFQFRILFDSDPFKRRIIPKA
jgi:hypothetical protein